MFQEYPKWVNGVIVENKEEELALTGEIVEEVEEEAPKKRGRPAKAE
jgi:hypothetical protein